MLTALVFCASVRFSSAASRLTRRCASVAGSGVVVVVCAIATASAVARKVEMNFDVVIE